MGVKTARWLQWIVTGHGNTGPPPVEGRRAFMTEREREIIADIDTYDQKRYETVSLLRNRLDTLEEDGIWLAKHHPELFRELQEAVCEIEIEQ
jgi:hypothetical protein